MQDFDAFLARVGDSWRCVADVDVIGAWTSLRNQGNLIVSQRAGRYGNRILLRTINARDDLVLAVYVDYQLVRGTAVGRRSRIIRTLRYSYELLDRDDHEILVFHWHPDAQGGRTEPHVHLSGARPIPLAARPSGEMPPPLDLRNAYIPTGEIEIEEILLMLIRDLGVQPLRPDWEQVLSENLRAAREAHPG